MSPDPLPQARTAALCLLPEAAGSLAPAASPLSSSEPRVLVLPGRLRGARLNARLAPQMREGELEPLLVAAGGGGRAYLRRRDGGWTQAAPEKLENRSAAPGSGGRGGAAGGGGGWTSRAPSPQAGRSLREGAEGGQGCAEAWAALGWAAAGGFGGGGGACTAGGGGGGYQGRCTAGEAAGQPKEGSVARPSEQVCSSRKRTE